MTNNQKKVLILSDGPVPTPEHTKVEGGGLRVWGLANGIKQNDPELHVDIAYNEVYKTENFTRSHNGIGIQTWKIDSVGELIKDYDTIVVSYCMGELSVAIARLVSTGQQLVLDCYVPIYVEVSARNGQDLHSEFSAFTVDVPRWAEVLKRGDVFLCASEPQKKFYEGVLAGIGRLNPATYHDDLVEIVPYGIYRDVPVQKNHPIQKLIGKDHEKFKKILWFGGIYPWFDLGELIDAVKKFNEITPAKLVIVGAKNPFNAHPDFLKRYDDLIEYIRAHKLEDLVIIQDWVNFDDRADWYLDSDVVVVINQEGKENSLSWRTRLVDFTWANLPIITNGGDPVSNFLDDKGAIALLSGVDARSITQKLKEVLSDAKAVEELKTNLLQAKDYFYWDNTTRSLTTAIQARKRPGDFLKFGMFDTAAPPQGASGKVHRIVRKLKKIPKYAKKYGLRNTAITAGSTLKRKIVSKMPSASVSSPRVVVVSHQLDISGAPFVIMDVASSMKKKYPSMPLEFYTFNPAHHDNIVELNHHGIRPKILFDRDAVIDFNKGDVVVFNTVAQSAPLKHRVFSDLESGKIKKLFWFVHEDEPELIFDKNETKSITNLLDRGLVEIVTAAVRTRDHYRGHFSNVSAINIQPQRVVTPPKYHRVLAEKDFDEKLRFILPGTIGDGRKGQLPVFYAFADFYHTTYKNNPSAYRDFELVYIGVEEDFLSRQIKKHAEKSLGQRFIPLGRMSHEACLEEMYKSNVTICYSIRECLPLFVYEGMTAGHPILRNDSSGVEEQLIDGENGYYIDSTDFEQLKLTVERILNKKKTSNKLLAKMSRKSQAIATQQEGNTYDLLIDNVYTVFNSENNER